MASYTFEQAFEMYFDAWKDEQESSMERYLRDRITHWDKDYWDSFYFSYEYVDGEGDYWITVTSAEGEKYMFKVYGAVAERELNKVISELYDGEYDNRFGKINWRDIDFYGEIEHIGFIPEPLIA